MKVPALIVEMMRQGYTNAEIRRYTGRHPEALARIRTQLSLHQGPVRPPLTVMERIQAEALPTGQVRDYDRRREPTSPEAAAANRRRLEESLGLKPEQAARRARRTKTAA